jgi:hypothetical protein
VGNNQEGIMSMWRIQYEVQGRMDFPLDMLRYDGSFPYSSEDVANIEKVGNEERLTTRTVRLVHYADTKHWQPTAGRWQSFLWSVVPSSIGVSKVG